MSKNKVKYNLRNVYYAPHTLGTSGEVTGFGTPVAWPGAVSISLDAENLETDFYADGYDYFFRRMNNGYSGDFESALVPESFKTDVLKYTADSAGVVVETGEEKPVNFALLFQFDGDASNTRHVLYNCAVGRPSIASATIGENADPQTETASITAKRLEGYGVHAYCDESSSAYEGWNSAVYKPTAQSGD